MYQGDVLLLMSCSYLKVKPCQELLLCQTHDKGSVISEIVMWLVARIYYIFGSSVSQLAKLVINKGINPNYSACISQIKIF